MTTMIIDHPEPSSSIIRKTAIQISNDVGSNNYFAFNPWFKGRCYFLCFHCDAPLYQEKGADTHKENCAKFPLMRDIEAMSSADWQIIYVFGTLAEGQKHFQTIKDAFYTKITPLIETIA